MKTMKKQGDRKSRAAEPESSKRMETVVIAREFASEREISGLLSDYVRHDRSDTASAPEWLAAEGF